MTVAKNIRMLRAGAGMTQQELADIVDMTREAVAQWETGAALPRLGTAIKLAEHFGVTLDELVEGEGSKAETVYQEESNKLIAEVGLSAAIQETFGFAILHIELFETYKSNDLYETVTFGVKGQGYTWNLVNDTLYISNAYGSEIFGYTADVFEGR